MNDAYVHSNGAGFNHPQHPNSASMPSALMTPDHSSAAAAAAAAADFQNQQQLQQRMRNHPQYQTNPVIPSKRAREDQTPAYAGFSQGNAHLQNGSANASPSPIMANQLRPGGVPQRVSTASPHPFSQASPSQSEHGSRTDTPQNSNQYVQNPEFPPAFNQNFTPPPGRASAPPQSGTPQMQQPQMFQQQQQQPGQPPLPGQPRPPQNQLEQSKMLYQMQLQQQMQQQRNMLARQGNLPPGANPMAKGPMPMPNGQMVGRPQQPPNPPRGGPNPESFMKSLVQFMQQKQLPLDMNPHVGDRQIALLPLYMAVVKFGGYKKVTQANGWNQVAQALQFHPIQYPNAHAQLKSHYERNLALFEEAWQTNQQRQRAAMMQQNVAMAGAPQMPPMKQMNPQAMQQSPNFLQQQHNLQQQQQQQQHGISSLGKQMPPMHHSQQPSVNGFSTPQPSQGPPHPMAQQNHARNSISRSINATPPQNGPSFAIPSPMSASKPINMFASQTDLSAQVPHTPIELPEKLEVRKRVLDTYGGYELVSLAKLGHDLQALRPDVPSVEELGVLGTIDLHALTMSLQSGIHSEMRLALDTLTSLSMSAARLDMRQCEDLVEVMIDCAEEQVEMLAENAAEVSDVMLISSYEDVARACRFDQQNLRELPPFGSPEYELDRSVDRLICLTTILRNLSFEEANHLMLADELVIKFLCVVIRYLGTRNMLLRTNHNTIDFMKDVITLLSNLAQSIELPGREQALCLMHFLLAFAPCPPPNASDSTVSFSSYDPAIHPYLPCALDTLAKLLARDEPNRSHYKTIFASDVASLPPYDLLTRTFGLAISALPDEKLEMRRGIGLIPLIEMRKPLLMQGMLAAEILSNLAPGYDAGVARSWMASDDGFAQKLSRLIVAAICAESPPPPQHQRPGTFPRGVEDEALLNIAMGGVAVLRRLAEKSRDPDDPTSDIPLSCLPSKDDMLRALRMTSPRLQGVLKQLCAYPGLCT